MTSPEYSSSAANPLKKFKLVFLGEQSVGKTSLITRFARFELYRADPRCMILLTIPTKQR
jgi:GTPase SAR1 family protein